MPALQVREFPDELYDELKEYAASQHRSMAQQVIVAVEQMLACDEGAQAGEPRT
ncbi:ribbon-helix-helix domain-containing protein, partial [Rubneribacter sp.]